MTTGYLVYGTKAGALVRSAAAARAQGCQAGDVTQLWWDVREDPTTPGQWLVLLDETRPVFAKAVLAAAERLQVLTDPTTLAALG